MAIKIDKTALAQKINTLEGLDAETKSQLLELLHERKRYGLIWEEKEEDVEERLRNELPVLREVKERAIIADDPEAPDHILIEGDNLEALTTLSYTHENQIDVIYIDPPYNTGNKDFVYNDRFVDADDEYHHSKWLSFMAKRLRIAKRLLSDKGVIFISIDDNEQAALKLLCDEIFEEKNFVASPVRKRRKSQANLSKNISTIHEYVLIYRKTELFELNKIQANIDASEYKNIDNDVRGAYKTMPCTNKGGTIYSIITPTGKIITDEWRFKKETYLELLRDNKIVFPKNGEGKPRYKLFLSDKKESGVIANSWWDNLESNQEGAVLLKNILGTEGFNNPKPVGLIEYILQLASSKSSTILDFFAGSGTTLHATMQLNADDGGHRKCILVTNNENHICEEVTYERNKRVINGYTTPKGEQIAGLKNNTLRYYRTNFVARNSSATAKRELMRAATDMLCIKNDIYTEQSLFGNRKFRKDVLRYFADGSRAMLIIYTPDAIETVVEQLQTMQPATPVIVYVFSLNDYAMDADFETVADRVELCALPAAILNAYRKVLPRKQQPASQQEPANDYSGEFNFEEDAL